MAECQENPCSKQTRYLKFKWLQRDSKPQSLTSETNTRPFGPTGQMIELCCEYLSVRCIWLYVLIMSRTCFRANLHSIVCLNVKELLARSRCHIWSLSNSNGTATGMWVRVPLQSLKFQISRLFWARTFLTFKQL